jgi:hypothetical protein
MSVFRHPFLTRGIVRTSEGAFLVSRGRVEIPDAIGESLGWLPVGDQDDRTVADRGPSDYLSVAIGAQPDLRRA